MCPAGLPDQDYEPKQRQQDPQNKDTKEKEHWEDPQKDHLRERQGRIPITLRSLQHSMDPPGSRVGLQ